MCSQRNKGSRRAKDDAASDASVAFVPDIPACDRPRKAQTNRVWPVYCLDSLRTMCVLAVASADVST